MGHDVAPVGNHKLRTENLESLAADLAERLNALVLYGHLDEGVTEEDWKTATYDFIELGRAGDTGGKCYELVDTYFSDKIRHPEKNHPVCYDFREHIVDPEYEYSCFIFQDSFLLDTPFYSRWWNFCRHFTGENDGWDYIQEHRDRWRKEVELFGGDVALYLDDQSEIHFTDMHFEGISFEQGLTELKTLCVPLDVSDWVRAGKPPLLQYPLAFYDDFSS